MRVSVRYASCILRQAVTIELESVNVPLLQTTLYLRRSKQLSIDVEQQVFGQLVQDRGCTLRKPLLQVTR